MSTYEEALAWTDRHPGARRTISLAKLVPLWTADCGVSLREGIDSRDEDRTALVLRVLTHVAARGEDSELIAAGHPFCRDAPRGDRRSRQRGAEKTPYHVGAEAGVRDCD
jgi:hypothetical protein